MTERRLSRRSETVFDAAPGVAAAPLAIALMRVSHPAAPELREGPSEVIEDDRVEPTTNGPLREGAVRR